MEEVDNSKAAGVEVLIHHKGETVWHKALGFSSLQDNRLLEKNSIYYIQSMTKPIMSVAIMQLVEQGKLNLADDAADYYPPLRKLRVIKDIATGIPWANCFCKAAYNHSTITNPYKWSFTRTRRNPV